MVQCVLQEISWPATRAPFLVVVFVEYEKEVEQGKNYHPSLSRLWSSASRQKDLYLYARSDRFYSYRDDLKSWQRRAFLHVIRFKCLMVN